MLLLTMLARWPLRPRELTLGLPDASARADTSPCPASALPPPDLVKKL